MSVVWQRMRRLAAVTSLVTVLDVAMLVALRRAGLPVALADGLAVLTAALASYLLHRSITFADDPHVRWVHRARTFIWIAALTGGLDVTVLQLVVARLQVRSLSSLLAAKALSLLLAGLVRLWLYRDRLLQEVREEQQQRVARPDPPGSLRLSVIVPAYRERARIATTVARLRAALGRLAATGGAEIVVVDDGSGDGTAEAARQAGADQVIEERENRGKGAAVRVGVLVARGRAIAFTDADLAYAPEHLLRLLAEVEAGWDVVVGSRKHVEAVTLVRARRLRELSGRLFNLLTEVVLLGHYRDTQCGLKAFRADVARLLLSRTRLDGFAFDVELFHLAERYRLSLTEVPVTLASSSSSSVRVGVEGVRMVRDLFRIRRWAGRGLYDLSEPRERMLLRS